MTRIIKILFIALSTLYAAPSISVPGSLTHENTVELGETIKGSIPILNRGDSVGRVKVYVMDYLFNSEGQTFYEKLGFNPRSNGNWIKTSRTYLEIPPNNEVNFTYTLQVPKTLKKDGTYWSIILVEPLLPPPTDTGQKNTASIQTVMRYGIQVVTHLGKTGKYDLKIANKNIESNDEKKYFSIDVENSGSLMLAPQISVELFNNLGNYIGNFKGPKLRIFPTCSVKYSVDLGNLSKGDYKAVLILDHNEGEVFGAQYDLSL